MSASSVTCATNDTPVRIETLPGSFSVAFGALTACTPWPVQTGAWTDASRTSSALADAGEEVQPLASPKTGHQPALSVAFQHNFIEAGLSRLALPPPLHRAAATSAVKVVTDFRSGSRRCDRVQDGLGDGHGRDGAANEPSGACCQRAPNQRAPASLPPRASRGNEPVPSPRVPYDVTGDIDL